MPCPGPKKLPPAQAAPQAAPASQAVSADAGGGGALLPPPTDGGAPPPIFQGNETEGGGYDSAPPPSFEPQQQATPAPPPDEDEYVPEGKDEQHAPAPTSPGGQAPSSPVKDSNLTVATIPEESTALDLQPAPPIAPNAAFEKARIQALIDSYKAKSKEGFSCDLLTEEKSTVCKYFVDEAFGTVSVKSAEDSCCMAQCRIASIVDIFCVVDDGPSAFPPKIVQQVPVEKRPFLIMVVFCDSKKRPFRFCIVFPNDTARTEFMDVMRVFNTQGANIPAADDDPLIKKSGSTLPGQTAVNHPSAGVSVFLRSCGVQGGRGALGPLITRAMKTTKNATLEMLSQADVVPYLAVFGFAAADHNNWKVAPCLQKRPRLLTHVTQHIEVAGHTWYMVENSLFMEGRGRNPRLDWQVPRRLSNLRSGTYDFVKSSLGPAYDRYFSNAPFASRGGLPGTTARLDRWFHTLCECLLSGAASPYVLAQVLWSLETPNPEVGATSERAGP